MGELSFSCTKLTISALAKKKTCISLILFCDLYKSSIACSTKRTLFKKNQEKSAKHKVPGHNRISNKERKKLFPKFYRMRKFLERCWSFRNLSIAYFLPRKKTYVNYFYFPFPCKLDFFLVLLFCGEIG